MVEDAGRTNTEWLDALGHDTGGSSAAAVDLCAYLRPSVARVLRGLGATEIEETLQETLVQILTNLETFRGDSAFTTWATAVAIRVAFRELRRRKVRAHRVDRFAEVRDEVEHIVDAKAVPAFEAAAQSQVVEALRAAIETSLTERQRVAIVAELSGVPTVEIADRLGTNQNALYKLVHDGRKKLRKVLETSGFSADSLDGGAR